MQVTQQLDGFFSGGSEIHFVTASSTVIDADNYIAAVSLHIRQQFDYSRKDIRNGTYHYLNVNFDPDWTEEELVNYVAAVEIDKKTEWTFGIKTSIKIKNVTVSPSFSYKVNNGNDFIGEVEMPRYYFMQSQTNPSLIGHGTYAGNPKRPLGSAIKYTTKVIKY